MVLGRTNPQLGFDPFGAERKVAPDRVSHASPQKDEMVERMYQDYSRIPMGDYFGDISRFISSTDYIMENCAPNPAQIEMLLEMIVGDSRHKVLESRKTGLFLTALMQNSYTYGNHNDFTFSAEEFLIDNLGVGLKGTEGKLITLNIEGNAGLMCGAYSQYSIFNILGDASSLCGEYAQNSQFDIHGDPGWMCGKESFSSMFTVYNPKMYELLEKELDESNQLVLADENGNVIKRRWQKWF